MATVKTRPDGTWTFFRRPTSRSVGVALLVIAGVFMLPVFIAGYYGGLGAAGIATIFPGLFALFGLLYARGGGRVVVNPSSRSIRVAWVEGVASDFDTVILTTDTRTVHTDQGQTQVREWSVGLVERVINPESVEEFERLLARVESSETLSAETKASILEKFQRNREFMVRDSLVVMISSDELTAWRVGERLAKDLGLPLLDVAGGSVVQRTPAQLDESLVARLRRADDTPDDPGPPPEHVDVEAMGHRLRLVWRSRLPGPIAIAWMMGVFGLIAAGMLLIDEVGVHLAAILGGVALLFVPVYVASLRGDGRKELEIVGGTVRYTSMRPWPKTEQMSLDAIEHVRHHEQPGSYVSLMSDGRVMRLPASDEQGEWIRGKIEHWLASTVRPTAASKASHG